MADFDERGYERDHSREPVRTKAKIMIEKLWHECVITNISPAGARLYAQFNVSQGRAVRLQIGEHGQLDANVIWCLGDEIGLEFNDVPAEMAGVLIGLAALG
jgi:hypothetical protein